MSTCAGALLLPPLRGEKVGMRGARRESIRRGCFYGFASVCCPQGPSYARALPLPHAPFTPPLSAEEGEREDAGAVPDNFFTRSSDGDTAFIRQQVGIRNTPSRNVDDFGVSSAETVRPGSAI